MGEAVAVGSESSRLPHLHILLTIPEACLLGHLQHWSHFADGETDRAQVWGSRVGRAGRPPAAMSLDVPSAGLAWRPIPRPPFPASSCHGISILRQNKGSRYPGLTFWEQGPKQ